MKRLLANATVMLGLWLYLSGAAYAQLKDNIEINPFFGGSWYESKNFEIGFPQSITPIPGKFRLDRAWRGGVRLGVYTRGHWSQEFYYSYEPNVAHIIRVGAPSTSVNLPLSVNNYGVNAIYYLNGSESNAVRPFVSAGIGGTAYLFKSEATSIARDPLRGNLPDLDNSNELTFNYGIGLKTRSSGWLGFRADVRGFVSRPPSFGLARHSNDPNATVFPVGGAFNNAEATAGLVFYFFHKR
jgi:hypothetical protein